MHGDHPIGNAASQRAAGMAMAPAAPGPDTPDHSSAIDPPDASPQRTPAADLREAIGKRARVGENRRARLDTMPPLVCAQIAAHLRGGGGDSSALATGSRALNAAWAPHALADKLRAAMHAPAMTYDVAHFADIITAAAALPPALRFDVLREIPGALCNSLDACGPGMEAVLLALLHVNHGFEPAQQLLMMDRISGAVHHPAFRRHALDNTSPTICRSGAEQMFCRFSSDLKNLFAQTVAETGAARLTDDAIARLPHAALRHARGDLEKSRSTLMAYGFCMLSDGLYLFRLPHSRATLWNTLFDSIEGTALPIAAMQINALVPHIDELAIDALRQAAFERVLGAIGDLPAVLRPHCLQQVTDYLQCVRERDGEARLFQRAMDIAGALPAEHRPQAWEVLAGAVKTRPTDCRLDTFDAILAQVTELPAHTQQDPLDSLAEQIDDLPGSRARGSRYDALHTAIRSLPAAMQPEPAGTLFSAIQSLLPHPVRHLRFLEATRFIQEHPVANRAVMLDGLNEALWCHSNDGVKMQCFEEYIALVHQQAPDEIAELLQAVYDSDMLLLPDGVKFGIGLRLLQAAGSLPAALQVGQVGYAAALCVELESAYCGSMMAMIVPRLACLPLPLHAQGEREVQDQLDAAVDRLDLVNEELQTAVPAFAALLAASDHLPDGLRLRLLRRLRVALTDCAPEMQPGLAQQLTARCNALPLHLITRMLAEAGGG